MATKKKDGARRGRRPDGQIQVGLRLPPALVGRIAHVAAGIAAQAPPGEHRATKADVYRMALTRGLDSLVAQHGLDDAVEI